MHNRGNKKKEAFNSLLVNHEGLEPPTFASVAQRSNPTELMIHKLYPYYSYQNI